MYRYRYSTVPHGEPASLVPDGVHGCGESLEIVAAHASPYGEGDYHKYGADSGWNVSGKLINGRWLPLAGEGGAHCEISTAHSVPDDEESMPVKCAM